MTRLLDVEPGKLLSHTEPFILPEPIQLSSFNDELPRSTEEIEADVERVKVSLEGSYAILSRINKAKEYKALGYDTFAEFVKKRFNLSSSMAYRYICASEVNSHLTSVALPPVSPNVAEKIAQHDPQMQVDIVVAAKKISDNTIYPERAKHLRGKVTPKSVEKAMQELGVKPIIIEEKKDDRPVPIAPTRQTIFADASEFQIEDHDERYVYVVTKLMGNIVKVKIEAEKMIDWLEQHGYIAER